MSAEPHPSRISTSTGQTARGEYDVALARLEREITRIEELQSQGGSDLALELCGVRDRLVTLAERAYSHLNGWQTVQLARHPSRPVLPHYLGAIVRDFCELAGDRCFRDDRAVTVGFGRIAGHKVMVIGHNKGKDTHDRVARCFGHPHPEGFRKALRAMKLAEKFGLPVVSFIDTPGAYPGIGAEERGTAQAIAVNLMEMARLRVPIICTVIGEGGSGGALGMGVGDRIGVLRHSYYSVITPEGCASILFRDGDRKQEAANELRITAGDLRRLGLIDEIIEEPLGGAHHDPRQAALLVEAFFVKSLSELKSVSPDILLQQRYARLRQLGNAFTSLRLAMADTKDVEANKERRT